MRKCVSLVPVPASVLGEELVVESEMEEWRRLLMDGRHDETKYVGGFQRDDRRLFRMRMVAVGVERYVNGAVRGVKLQESGNVERSLDLARSSCPRQ
jgi:hypothetical protein